MLISEVSRPVPSFSCSFSHPGLGESLPHPWGWSEDGQSPSCSGTPAPLPWARVPAGFLFHRNLLIYSVFREGLFGMGPIQGGPRRVPLPRCGRVWRDTVIPGRSPLPFPVDSVPWLISPLISRLIPPLRPRGDRAAPGPPFIHGHAGVGTGAGPRRAPANGRRRRRASRGRGPMGARRA